LVLITAIVAVVSSGGFVSGPEPGDPGTLEQPSRPLSSEELAQRTLLTAIDRLNDGDAQAWAAWLSGTGQSYEYTQTGPDGDTVGGASIRWNGGLRPTENGRSNLPCDVGAEPDGATNFVCTVEQTSDWLDPAGLSGETLMTFLIGKDQRLQWWGNEGLAQNAFAFNSGFYRWLEDTHPDVYEQVNPQTHSSFPGYMRLPSSMTLALEYVDEFVAQTDDNPVSR
jgi:hypothetical protein